MKTRVLVFEWSPVFHGGINPNCAGKYVADHYATNNFSKEAFTKVANTSSALIIKAWEEQLECYLEAIKELDSDTLKVVLVDSVCSCSTEILTTYDFVRIIKVTPVCIYPVEDREWDCEKFLSTIKEHGI